MLPVWFANVQRQPHAKSRLFCFPYAGGSSVIYSNWATALPVGMEVFPVQLPGRGTRFSAPPFTSLDRLVEQLVPVMEGVLDLPFYFFGHSMGALIAFELARAIRSHFQVQPQVVFISGRKAPGEHAVEGETSVYQLPREEFLTRLRLLNGTHPDLLANEEALELILPALRADFELVQTYQFRPGIKLSCSIKAFGGLEDQHSTEALIGGWKAFTSGDFSMEMLPGDHFFIQKERTRLLGSLRADIQKMAELKSSDAGRLRTANGAAAT